MSKWYPCIYCTEDLHCTKYSDDDSESWCVLGPCTAETPSNGDKIRRMTDAELAEFAVSTGQGCAPGKNFVECCFDHKDGPVEADCRKCWLGWLREEETE